MRIQRESKIPMLLDEVEKRLTILRERYKAARNDEQREEILEWVKPIQAEKKILEKIKRKRETDAEEI